MTLSTLPRYLLGRESAILEVIETRGVLLLGLLFVLSAGFAREYDGENLVAEPWHLLFPLAASVGSCLLLYGLLLAVADPPSETPLEPGRRFARFLGLYWMTAPLAWIYAIPVEGWLSPLGAVRFNLYLLTMVALWRVLLISRATAVLFGTSFPRIIFPVLLFGDGLMLFIVHFIPLPIFQLMGGVAHVVDRGGDRELRLRRSHARLDDFANLARRDSPRFGHGERRGSRLASASPATAL